LKLDAQNEPGVFLAFGLDNKFGAVILVNQSACSCETQCGFCGKLQRKETHLHTLGIASQAPWIEKCCNTSFYDFDLLSHSLSSSLLLAHNRTQCSSTLHLHAQMMTMLSSCHQTMKKLKICYSKLLKLSRSGPFLLSMKQITF